MVSAKRKAKRAKQAPRLTSSKVEQHVGEVWFGDITAPSKIPAELAVEERKQARGSWRPEED